MHDALIWAGIAICVTQSAALSGLNLAMFSLSRLRLEAAAHAGDERAARVLALRHDANGTLATILFGNVAVNVLLTLLADSVLTGVGAFLFSTVVITLLGEITPQAYFSRHALRVGSFLAPLLRFYRFLCYPVAKPVGMVLDALIGREPTPWFREAELREILRHHARHQDTEVGKLEATGAINFLALDDLPVRREGEPLEPASVFELPFERGRPVFPPIGRSADDPFLQRLADVGKKWIVIADPSHEPRLVLSSHQFLREALFGDDHFDPEVLCHHPLIVRDGERPLGKVLGRLTVHAETPDDDVIDRDLILLWTPEERRIITGSDLLGRLLRGIAQNVSVSTAPPPMVASES